MAGVFGIFVVSSILSNLYAQTNPFEPEFDGGVIEDGSGHGRGGKYKYYHRICRKYKCKRSRKKGKFKCVLK